MHKSSIVFCFDNCAAKSEDKFVLVWLKCCPRYWSRKKGIEGNFFEAEAVGRGWEMFPRFPFFYWSTLDNTEIRLGPNLYERRGKHNYWNRILFSFVWLFRNFWYPSTRTDEKKRLLWQTIPCCKQQGFFPSDIDKSLLLTRICPSDLDKSLLHIKFSSTK